MMQCRRLSQRAHQSEDAFSSRALRPFRRWPRLSLWNAVAAIPLRWSSWRLDARAGPFGARFAENGG